MKPKPADLVCACGAIWLLSTVPEKYREYVKAKFIEKHKGHLHNACITK